MTESRTDGTEFVGGTCPLRLGNACYCSKRLNSFVGAPAKTAVLLLAHGSPENPDQIPEFLSYVTGGRPLPPAVVEEIRRRYSLIGFSPLACWTLLQADQLSQSLQMPGAPASDSTAAPSSATEIFLLKWTSSSSGMIIHCS